MSTRCPQPSRGGPLLPVPTPLPQVGGGKAPPDPQGLTKCFWTKPKWSPWQAGFLGSYWKACPLLLPEQSTLLSSGKPDHSGPNPQGKTLPSLGPTSPCSPARRPRGRGRTLPGDRQDQPSQQARGRKEQSWREGKGRRGHLSSFSVPRE